MGPQSLSSKRFPVATFVTGVYWTGATASPYVYCLRRLTSPLTRSSSHACVFAIYKACSLATFNTLKAFYLIIHLAVLIFSPGINAVSFIADTHAYTEPVPTGNKLTLLYRGVWMCDTHRRTLTRAYIHRNGVIALLPSFSTSKAEIPRGHPSHPVTVARRHCRAPPGCSHLNL